MGEAAKWDKKRNWNNCNRKLGIVIEFKQTAKLAGKSGVRWEEKLEDGGKASETQPVVEQTSCVGVSPPLGVAVGSGSESNQNG